MGLIGNQLPDDNYNYKIWDARKWCKHMCHLGVHQKDIQNITNHADTISISYPIYWKISVNRYTINNINKYIVNPPFPNVPMLL